MRTYAIRVADTLRQSGETDSGDNAHILKCRGHM
nr:MAG TPA: hypothetical protein [Caudoviricetes sp.]DAD56298.1 MAG TPA: hypothetical protein [Caudoviricetes sp.]